jgi:hypothetical protein
MKLKNFISALAVGLVIACPITAMAGGINVKVDNKAVVFPDVQPVIVDGCTMVPVRGLFDTMGFSVSWNSTDRAVVLANSRFIIQLDETAITAVSQASNKAVTVDNSVLPRIIDDRFYMPLRSVAQCSGATVDWDANTKTVSIITDTYAKELAAIEQQSSYTADTSTDNGSEEIQTPSSYFDPEGDLTANEESYLRSVFTDLAKLKALAIEKDDPVLLRYYGIAHTTGEISVPATDYTEFGEICADLESLVPSATLKDVDEDVKAFVSSFRLAYQQTKIRKITNTDLTRAVDTKAKERARISSSFSGHLYAYFSSKDILFEKVFGDSCLDAMN